MRNLVLGCLFFGLTWAHADTCEPLQQNFNSQVMQNHFEAAEPILSEMEAECQRTQVEAAKQFYSDSLAKQANTLVNARQVSQAEQLLAKAKVSTWTIATVRGDIAAERKQWLDATQAYGLAYDLLDIKKPSGMEDQDWQEKRRLLLSMASEAQVLYGKIEPGTKRDGSPQGIRGFGTVKSVLPVHFATNSAKLNDDGLEDAAKLAAFLKVQKDLKNVVISGFADPRGSDEHNLRLSEQRAQKVVDYLKNQGVSANLKAVGKGELPPTETNFQNLTAEEQLQRWRRVELEKL